MKRSILLALVAALALALGANATASAAESGAQTAAKKKAAKKKAAKCKAKPKKKGKAKPKAGAFKLADGTYRHESEGVTVTVTGGGKRASASFSTCFLFGGSDMPLTTSGDTATASERYDQPIAGMPSLVTWSLTVRSTLNYSLRTSWDIGDGTCTDQKTFSGKLVKAG